METTLLLGKSIAEKIKTEITLEAQSFLKQTGLAPTLCAIQVGEEAASALYIKSQKRAAESCGIRHDLITLPITSSEADLVKEIGKANQNPKVHGVIIQTPLPKTFRADYVLDQIHPDKDVEAVTTSNLGRLGMNKSGLSPCTAGACLRMIEETKVDLFGKEAVVVGSSKTVGLPIFLLLVGKKMTSMICHTGTFKAGTFESHVRRADVLVVAAGKPNLVPGSWVKEGSIVIDVGINQLDGKTVGDVEFESAKQRAAFITPVPGGVGPVTVMMLLKNLVACAEKQRT